MKTLQIIYNKLNSVEKTELETHKVELTVVGDIEKTLNKIEKQTNALGDLEDVAKTTFDKYEQKLADVWVAALDVQSKLEDKAKKLTPDSNAINKMLNKAETAAKELGVKTDDIKGYKELKGAISDFNSVMEMSWKEIQNIGNIKL